MLAQTLSFTRSVSYNHRGQNIDLLGGSSYNRKDKSETVQKKSFPIGEKFFKVERKKSCKQVFTFKGHDIARKESRTLSIRSKDKIQNKIIAMYRASGKNFYFLTLTFIEHVPDEAATVILNKFLTVLRKQGEFNYVWVAEHQPDNKDKTIHFHLILDKRFKIQNINGLWVYQQYQFGLTNKIADNKIDSDFSTEQKKITVKDFFHARMFSTIQQYLNPVDVRKITGVDNLSMYLTNYITKNHETFNCCIWHCGRRVSALYTRTVIDRKQAEKVQDKKVNKKTTLDFTTGEIKEYIPKTFVGKYGMITGIYNKAYFGKFMHEIDFVNRFILSDPDKMEPINISNFDLHNLNFQ